MVLLPREEKGLARFFVHSALSFELLSGPEHLDRVNAQFFLVIQSLARSLSRTHARRRMHSCHTRNILAASRRLYVFDFLCYTSFSSFLISGFQMCTFLSLSRDARHTDDAFASHAIDIKSDDIGTSMFACMASTWELTSLC